MTDTNAGKYRPVIKINRLLKQVGKNVKSLIVL